MKAQQSPPVSCCLGTLSIKTTLFRSTVSEALAKPTQTAFSSYENAFFVLLHQQEQRLAFFSLVKAQQSPPVSSCLGKKGLTLSTKTTLFRSTVSEALAKPAKTAFSSYENAFFCILALTKTRTGLLFPDESLAIPSEWVLASDRGDGLFSPNHTVWKLLLRSTGKTNKNSIFELRKCIVSYSWIQRQNKDWFSCAS